MKLKAGELLGAYESLKLLSQQKLPIKGAYWVKRAMDKLQNEAKSIYEQRDELVKKHGKKGEDGRETVNAKEDPAAFTAFWGDFTVVLETEIDVECPVIQLDMLGNAEIDTSIMFALDKFIDGGEDD